MDRKYNVIDLFCGCGGFSRGFQQAGFNVRFGIDLWEDAVTTYKHNFPNAIICLCTSIPMPTLLVWEPKLSAASASWEPVQS